MTEQVSPVKCTVATEVSRLRGEMESWLLTRLLKLRFLQNTTCMHRKVNVKTPIQQMCRAVYTTVCEQ